MKICAATGNAGKLRELRRILEAQGHEVVSQKELGITIEPDETGTTFAENALIKAETICKVSGLPTIADDSGLCVDALGGAPGVYSARYCGHHGDDEANNDKLLDAITGQNAISQAREFCKAADATGIILTKLDGTAKGGCVVAVKQRLGLPVRFIGVGEGIDDLLPFTPEGFVEELLPRQWKH